MKILQGYSKNLAEAWRKYKTVYLKAVFTTLLNIYEEAFLRNKLTTFILKSFIIVVWQGSKYVFVPSIQNYSKSLGLQD